MAKSVGYFQFKWMIISNCAFGPRLSFIGKVLFLTKLLSFRKWAIKKVVIRVSSENFQWRMFRSKCHSLMCEWKQFCFYLAPPWNTHQSYDVARLRAHQKKFLVSWCAVLWHERLFIRRSNCDQLPHIEMDCLYEFEPQTLYVYSLWWLNPASV